MSHEENQSPAMEDEVQDNQNDLDSVIESLKKELDSVKEERDKLKNQAQGQDRKNTELTKLLDEEKKRKLTVEERIRQLEQAKEESEQRYLKELKEKQIMKIINEKQLPIKIAFKNLFDCATEEEMLQEADEIKKFLDEQTAKMFQEKANGGVPKKGHSLNANNNLENLSLDELMKLPMEKPDLSDAVIKEAQRRALNNL